MKAKDETIYGDLKAYGSFIASREEALKVTFEEITSIDAFFLKVSSFDEEDYFMVDYAKEKLLYYKVLEDGKWLLISLYDSSYFDDYEKVFKATLIKYIIALFFFVAVVLALHYIFTKEEHSKEKEKSLDDMKSFAHTDKLTRIANRSKLDEVLENSIQASKRFQQTFSVIFFDIDFFKSINDTFGHDIGDKALEGLAQFVLKYCRENDLFGRWGGEEFMIILQNTSLENAFHLANRLRHNIANSNIISQKKFTCSFGVVEYSTKEDKSSLIKRVDTLLYKAKNSGRNIVMS